MKIVALYKIWRGKEFLIPSIKSIYNHVDKIVFVSSDLSWSGQLGNNTLEVVEKWKSDSDHMGKIDIIKYNTTDQKKQYDTGFAHIRAKYPNCDLVQLIDSDEVWTEEAWSRSMSHIEDSDGIYAWRCAMRTYIKSIRFTIIGNEVNPVVFVKPDKGNVGVRSYNVEPYRIMGDVLVHHFALVRKDEDEVLGKIKNNVVGEEKGIALVDMAKWKKEVWDDLPNGKCYHYFQGCTDTWQKFEEVNIDSVPYTCRGIVA